MALMNMSYLLAGTVSTTPVMFMIAMLLVLVWEVVGWHSLNPWVLPKLGMPWSGRK